ncbi:MAG TPA: DinB family protein [Chitinophagaceae bacterium]|nr:DinB family protein [Chitinophagaceae bacterium]
MTIIEAFAQELEKEAITTRKMLERVPADKYDWKPHEKSMNLRQLAGHVAELPGWVSLTLTTSELDFEKNPYTSPPVETNADLLAYFENSLTEGKAELAKATEAQLELPWTLRSGQTIYSTEPKRDVIRMSLSQIIHHRAQLGVYLRLLNIPIPGSYGPSADEMHQ